jgi:hypothetical protein
MTPSGRRNALLMRPYTFDRLRPLLTVLNFGTRNDAAPGGICELSTFTVGDSLPMALLPWPFRPFAFVIPLKALPLDAWTLRSLLIQEEEQVMSDLPLASLIGFPLFCHSCPTGSEIRIRVCNEASAVRPFRIALLGSALQPT